MKFLTRNIILLINLIIGALAVAVKIGSTNPDEHYQTWAFISLGFPAIFFANIGFIIFWLFTHHRRHSLISIAVLIFCGSQSLSVFQFAPNNTDSCQYKIMTFNTKCFSYYDWRHNKLICDSIINFIKKENPDILCLQEYMTNPQAFDTYNSLINEAGFKYNIAYYHTRQTNGDNYGIATFAKIPIINHQYLKFENSSNSCLACDFIINNDTIRIYNCHLESYRLNDNEIDNVYNIEKNQHSRLKLFDTYKKMAAAFEKRGLQAQKIAQNIKNHNFPVIVCGDFNDVPTSFTYQTICNSRNLNDAFVEHGSGFGGTYIGKLPPFRIDFILYSQSINISNYRVCPEKLSDHRASVCNFDIIK